MGEIQFVKILEKDQVEQLKCGILSELLYEVSQSTLAKGKRKIATFNVDKVPEIAESISILYPNKRIESVVRAYIHEYGNVIPHKDQSSFNCCDDITAILYINKFDGGELRLESSKDIISFSPKIGYAVVFPKETRHWAEEVYSPKEILVLDLS